MLPTAVEQERHDSQQDWHQVEEQESELWELPPDEREARGAVLPDGSPVK